MLCGAAFSRLFRFKKKLVEVMIFTPTVATRADRAHHANPVQSNDALQKSRSVAKFREGNLAIDKLR